MVIGGTVIGIGTATSAVIRPTYEMTGATFSGMKTRAAMTDGNSAEISGAVTMVLPGASGQKFENGIETSIATATMYGETAAMSVGIGIGGNL